MSSLLHEVFDQKSLGRFRGLLSSNASKRAAAANPGKGKDKDVDTAVGSTGQSWGGAAASLSRSPRFSAFDSSGASNQPSKDDVNARDRFGRTVLHVVASWVPADNETDDPMDYLEALLSCPTVNVNLADRENGWTALHRSVYAGNLGISRRLLQHHDIDTHIRDLEGLTAFELLNSTILGTNPADLLDNLAPEDQLHPRRELVTWGANRNFVLGLQGDSDRTFPERVVLERTAKKNGAATAEDDEVFEPLRVVKVAMEKLHSGLLTDEKRDNFRLCGFGSTTGRLGHNSQHPQFSFLPLRDFSQQTVTDFALAQDHTILCTDKGDVWTFGLNAFSVLGYAVESTGSNKSTIAEEPVQATPKRLVGILKKEFVIGVAASRYHSAAFTADSLFTWGKNNGQLGYPTHSTPLQQTPRKVTSLTSPVKQMCATETATVCLLEGGEVFVLHRDAHFKIAFPTARFPSAMQVYRPRARPSITKVSGSGTTFIALSDIGDVFAWQLENPTTESSATFQAIGRDIKPQRIWEDRKTFTAVRDAAIAGNTVVLCTRSGHVYVRSRKKELNSVKGFELRGSAAQSSNAKKGQYKFTRVSNLQRVVNVAVSPSGGFGAIRSDAPLLRIDITGETLSEALLDVLPHYRRLAEDQADPKQANATNIPLLSLADGSDDYDDDIDHDRSVLQDLCTILERWDPTWSISRAGSDIVLVAGSSGAKLPAHSTILAARSSVLAEVLQGRSVSGFSFSSDSGALTIPSCSHATALILLQYLYGDELPAIYDARLSSRINVAFPKLKIEAAKIKTELQALAAHLKLPALQTALKQYGKAIPEPSLHQSMGDLLSSTASADVIIETESREFHSHSVLLRARCPFFQAMFDDPDWYTARTLGSDRRQEVIRISMQHIPDDVMEIVLQHIYLDEDAPMFTEKTFSRVNDKIDYVMTVIAAANELLLDRLKAICSNTLRPLVNMHTVCSVLCEAIFYEASQLRDCCMQYICCNLETMLEQNLLDVLPSYAMQELATFCRSRQLARLPKTARSTIKYDQLKNVYADWLADRDIPKATGAYRRFCRQNPVKSPKLSPSLLSPSSMKMSPLPGTSPLALSPPRYPQHMVPPSPTLLPSPDPSPLVRPARSHEEDIMFEMDDLTLEEPAAPVLQRFPSVAGTSASAAKPAWHRPAPLTEAPTKLRDILAEASSPPISAPPRFRRVSEEGGPSPLSPPSKLSQKDRKRQQQASLAQNAEKAAEPAASPWKPKAPPTAWAPPVLALAKDKPSSINLRSVDAFTPGTSPSPISAASRKFPTSSPLSSSPSTSATFQGSPIPHNPASGVGAPVITPTRAIPKRVVSHGTGPPVTRASDTPWVSYTSTVATASPSAAEGAAPSFSHIQNLQATERHAIRSGPRSLAEIQEEEKRDREEAEFLTWFEEESRRTQRELGVGAEGQSSRGGKDGRGRARGSRRGSGRGGGPSRGRGRGQQGASNSQSARIDD